jgi:hypothetical protein
LGVAAVADISYNPEIRHAILHGQPIYDNHPAIDDFYNSCRTVNNINADIKCSAPTFNSLLCNRLFKGQSPTHNKTKQALEIPKSLSRVMTSKQTNKQRTTDRQKLTDKDVDKNIPTQTKKPRAENPISTVVTYISLVHAVSADWKVRDHNPLVFPGSNDVKDIVCFAHITEHQVCHQPKCLYHHPTKPSEIGTIAESKKFLCWVDNDSTITCWVGDTKK